MDSCAHMESCLAAAEAAECPLDWSNFLVQYVTLLARQGDTARLDALCTSLLGPLSWEPSGSGGASEDPRSSWVGGSYRNGSRGAKGGGMHHAGRDPATLAGAGAAASHRQNGYSGTGECEGRGASTRGMLALLRLTDAASEASRFFRV